MDISRLDKAVHLIIKTLGVRYEFKEVAAESIVSGLVLVIDMRMQGGLTSDSKALGWKSTQTRTEMLGSFLSLAVKRTWTLVRMQYLVEKVTGVGRPV